MKCLVVVLVLCLYVLLVITSNLQPRLLCVQKMVILLALIALSLTSGQVIYTTVPSTNNGPAYVIFEEGTLNVSLYCEVIQNSIQVQTSWFVKRQTDSSPILTDYNSAGELISPADLVGKITAIGDVISGSSLTLETNFTILNFTNEFDLVKIKCGPQLREFNLGFPGIN